MAKKLIDVMDTTFRDGFQSVFGGRVFMEDFFPALEAAKHAGIRHFEFGGGARFQSLYFYLNEDAFTMMDKFRDIVGPEANLQTLARGVNTVMLETASSDMIDLHAKMFAKHGTTTIRNFDALNDVENLKHSGASIKKHGMNHEVVVTMMDLPPGCEGAHDVAFYEKTLRDILDAGIEYDSVCFKDARGTANPKKVYETIKMAKKLLPDDVHVRLHTHETAGVSVVSYMAALDAGADGIDLAAAPVSGGTSQPDIITMLHATRGTNYDLGGLDMDKILTYEDVLKDSLKDYFMPPEASQVSPMITFSPMPGGALTANTQMMRDNNMLEKFPEVIRAMREVVERGGFGTSVTPVSQFYFQQAFNNVMFGPWNKIADGYGKMVLGYFGKTPTAPDAEIVNIASDQLKLNPTTESALSLADKDETKTITYFTNMLKEENLEVTDENIFIAAACKDKGIAFLKGDAETSVRKIDDVQKETKVSSGEAKDYTVMVNGTSYSVQVADGSGANIQVTPGAAAAAPVVAAAAPAGAAGGEEVQSQLNGAVWKILLSPGDAVAKDQVIMILEAMKMEIEIPSPCDGVIATIDVKEGDAVENGQVLATI